MQMCLRKKFHKSKRIKRCKTTTGSYRSKMFNKKQVSMNLKKVECSCCRTISCRWRKSKSKKLSSINFSRSCILTTKTRSIRQSKKLSQRNLQKLKADKARKFRHSICFFMNLSNQSRVNRFNPSSAKMLSKRLSNLRMTLGLDYCLEP